MLAQIITFSQRCKHIRFFGRDRADAQWRCKSSYLDLYRRESGRMRMDFATTFAPKKTKWSRLRPLLILVAKVVATTAHKMVATATTFFDLKPF